jgi:hypothetical protein
MWPWSAVEKWDAAKEVQGGRFRLVHSVGLAVQEAPAVLEVLPVVAMNRPVWNHPVLRHFPALLVLTDDRNRVPDPV